MYRYLCLNAISPVGLERFNDKYTETNKLDEADMILVRSAGMKDMKLPEGVLAVARAGAGVNNIPLEDYAAQGVVVFNTPGANANGVKELVFAGMLLAARDIIGGVNWVKEQNDNPDVAAETESEKKRFAGTELSGKKLGVIGLGAIGALVANAATHFGMDVYGYDPFISVDSAWNLSRSVRHINDVNDLFRECDYITLHIPLTPDTKGMIGEEQIALMKPTAVVLNFARDLLVDEDAMMKALDEKRIHRYVSDFPNVKTAGHKRVILSPHLGASTSESEDNCAKMAVSELREYIEYGNIKNSVNFPNCSLGKLSSAARITICHRNVKKMISKFSAILEETNIANMSNASRGEYAYTMFDLEEKASPATLKRLREIDDVLLVRYFEENR